MSVVGQDAILRADCQSALPIMGETGIILPQPIVLANPDPKWSKAFRTEGAKIRTILTTEALQIEHVGSTSVPGLQAKPVIDTLLVVIDSSDENAYVPSLESAGYQLKIREPNWHEHRMFKGPGADINLHIFSQGCPEITRMLLFRDWLRTHAADRDVYEQTKRALADQEWGTVQDYADAKTAVVEEILTRAVKHEISG